ncbi:tRNA 2-thiouridine(34) synthase MnmA, partial [Candidatus Phytoplasma sp. Tabriz.2]|nr:tRNA 2-thiouridine(34) synthase MnmA [Candidatus Phytoplasma australiense]
CIKKKDGMYFFFKGIDTTKDQSYFLYTLKENQLKKILFPLGNLKKIQVRKIAENIMLDVAKKKDSTGICFIGPRNIKTFLS